LGFPGRASMKGNRSDSRVEPQKLYSILMSSLAVGAAISVAVGGLLLIGRVNVGLTIGTFVVVSILIAVSVLILRSNRRAQDLGAVLSVLAITSSAFNPAHLLALYEFYKFQFVDLAMILGFYVFPLLYLFLWVKSRATARTQSI
jgi:hypothetical protein